VRIPLTVIGGYLGAGKTTLVNHVLRHAEGRRIGVIVNDFGTVGVDVALLAAASEHDARPGRIISLANGCVCCTIGTGLQDALAGLLALDPAPDHIVVEVSGVADPAGAAAWATVPPFEPGGVVVRWRVIDSSVKRSCGSWPAPI
jgi:G3E family GTPase